MHWGDIGDATIQYEFVAFHSDEDEDESTLKAGCMKIKCIGLNDPFFGKMQHGKKTLFKLSPATIPPTLVLFYHSTRGTGASCPYCERW